MGTMKKDPWVHEESLTEAQIQELRKGFNTKIFTDTNSISWSLADKLNTMNLADRTEMIKGDHGRIHFSEDIDEIKMYEMAKLLVEGGYSVKVFHYEGHYYLIEFEWED